jgi:hypothetical protein
MFQTYATDCTLQDLIIDIEDSWLVLCSNGGTEKYTIVTYTPCRNQAVKIILDMIANDVTCSNNYLILDIAKLVPFDHNRDDNANFDSSPEEWYSKSKPPYQ